ncbi:MAG: calcium-binding protein [Pseudomonadota bacterium]
MVALRVTGTVGQGLGALATGVDHLEMIATPTGPVLVALSAAGGGLVTLSFGANGQANVSDTQSLTQGFWDQSNGTLSLIATGDSVFAAIASEGDNRVLGYEIDGAAIGQAGALQGDGLSAAGNTVYQVSGDAYLFAAGADGTLRCFRPAENDTFMAGQVTQDANDTFHAVPGVVDALSVGGRDFLITACLKDTGISVFEVDPDTGHVAHTGAVGAHMGLGLFETAVDMETTVVGDQGYALVVTRSETSDSAALTVVAITQDGQLRVTDHILDNQLSRFGKATELEVVQNGDWTYVLASGGDDGVSLFALTPAGRLVHLDTLASATGAMLDSVSGMAAAIAQDGDLQILLAQHTATGFTQLEVGLSDQGDVRMGTGGGLSGTVQNDMLLGSAAADTIDGGAGDDILEDGAGQDVLRGGAGADLFVLSADGQHDVIEGFEAGQDRIDLSDVPFLYSMDQITYSSRAWGAVITYRGETLELRSADGGSLQDWQIASAIDWTIDRPLLVLSDAAPMPVLEGSSGADTIEGGDGNDTVRGFAGADSLIAGAGDDLIEAGTGDDTILAGDGNDTVAGEDGRDLIFLGRGADVFLDDGETGSHQADTVFGGDGDDTLTSLAGGDELHGEAGNDRLNGGADADVIYGGPNFDTVYAGAGDDMVWGGDGRDLIFLGLGRDLYLDNAQGGDLGRDTVFAGEDDDTIEGGNGDDEFHGEWGNDVINARLGNDTVYGGGNDDTISAGEGDDVVWGGNGRDLVYLNQGNDVFNDSGQNSAFARDTVFGGYGNDTINGGGGDDVFYGEWGNDLIFGDLANDSVFGGEGDDSLYAGSGDDMVWGGNGRDLVFLNQGNDVFIDNDQGGELGRDTVFGGLGDDTIKGGNGDDVFHGEDGNDVINGRQGNDLVYGGANFDTIYAGDGNDTVFGGDGRDLTYLGTGNDLFNDNGQGGEAGRDTVYAGLGDDTIEGGNGDDVFHGEDGNDVINARLGNDSVYAGRFDDTVYAGEGDDLVFGGLGRDEIWLGAGNDRYVDTNQGDQFGRDTITGGAGADTFVFGTLISEDVITDFEVGVDRLELAAALVGGRTAQEAASAGTVTAGGVLLDFGAGQSLFLEGVMTTSGLEDAILIY